MLEKIKKYKSIIMYLIFGVLTTVINIVVYTLCYNSIMLNNISSTVIAWLIAVVFAFLVNKAFVFESTSVKKDVLFYEIITFFSLRFTTGLIDLLLMYIAVDVLELNSFLMKTLSNIIVTIINYIASKIVIFKKTKD